MNSTAIAAAPNVTTSSQYTTRTPAPASSSPASAGPTIAPVWNSAWNIALAAGTERSPTIPGIIALRAALSIPLSAAVTAGNRNSGHSAGPKSEFSASPALDAAPSTSTTSSIRRRSTASTTDPPNSDPRISGNSWASETSPTYSEEWVIVYTWYGTATAVSWLPRTDTPRPLISAR